jgi:branched-subunit amino acid ABC-type transport system permease component
VNEGFDWLFLAEISLAGLGSGGLLALAGLALVIIYKATRVVNLAIGEMLMMSAYLFFALTATQFGGWQHALILALLFLLGMLFTDGINGLWIARLIARADQVALVASRVMGLVVSGISLLVATFGLAKLALPAVDAWSDGKELVFGAALIAIVASSFLLAVRLTRPPLAQGL